MMNAIIQNTLAFAAIAAAVYYLIRKFIWKKKKASKKPCGGDDGCGCN